MTPLRAEGPLPVLSRSTTTPHNQPPPPLHSKQAPARTDIIARPLRGKELATYDETVATEEEHQPYEEAGLKFRFPKADTKFDSEVLLIALEQLLDRFEKNETSLRAHAIRAELKQKHFATRALSERYKEFQPIILDLIGQLKARKEEHIAQSERRTFGTSPTSSYQILRTKLAQTRSEFKSKATDIVLQEHERKQLRKEIIDIKNKVSDISNEHLRFLAFTANLSALRHQPEGKGNSKEYNSALIMRVRSKECKIGTLLIPEVLHTLREDAGRKGADVADCVA